MKGFIVYQTYRVEHSKAYVYLFGRLENGKSFCTVNHFRPYFCIKKEDVATAEKLPATIPFDVEETPWKTMQEHPVVRIVYDVPKDTVQLRKLFEEHKIKCYEADIRFTQRFLMDMNVKRSVEIEGSYEEGDHVDRVFKEPVLSPVDWYPDLKILSFDIETNADATRLYSISIIVEGEKNEVLIVSDKEDLKHAMTFPDEKVLLEHFREQVLALDPDIITGWNTIDFDLKVLRDKFKQHNIPYKLGRWDWECTLRIESSFLRESTADFPGRQVLDGIQMLKLNFISLPNYKLDTAAQELLGEKKLIGQTGKGNAIDDAFTNDQQKLVDYNLKDSQLVLDILEKTNAVDIMINRAMLTGMSLDKVRGSIASFDSLYLRELRKRNYVAPCAGMAPRDEQIAGGYVMQSKPGIYDHVVVCDFKSLYPSLMRTFNIDPLAYEQGKDAKNPENKDKWISSPNGVVFSTSDGILPALLQQFWEARDVAKKKKDDRASFAIKILMNSFFGVLASPLCRFYSLDLGNAITSFARHYIQMTIDKVDELGYDVIYGDTDSTFIDLKADSYEMAEKTGKEIGKKITAYYDEQIKTEYHRESFMELELDKVFVHFIMPKLRGTDIGAKKRYAGIVLKDGKEKLEVTGLEIVRRDWTELAKQFQSKILEMVFKKEDPSQFIREFVEDLKAGKLDDLLVYQKGIRKELSSYTKTTPPHVKAARLLEEKGGKLSSNVIQYVVTLDGPYPVDLGDIPSIDYDHYVEKQLRTIADAILVFFDTTFDDALKGTKQMTLGGF